MRYDLMTYSGVMQEWKRRSMGGCYYRFDKGVLPQDKSWHVFLMVGSLVLLCCVLFVRWWLCV